MIKFIRFLWLAGALVACHRTSGPPGDRDVVQSPREPERDTTAMHANTKATVRADGKPAQPPPPPETPPPEADPDSAEAAVDVVRAYYAAVRARDYSQAYALWGNSGKDSQQTFEGFSRGYSETQSVDVEPGAPSRIEGAAGSRYVTVPVVVRAKTTTDLGQCFTGSYVLRRSEVDGATEAQRHWHLYSADLKRCSRP